MSGATYRIDLAHRPGDQFPWLATVIRLSDGMALGAFTEVHEQDAVTAAYRWIEENTRAREPYSLYADEEGKPWTGSVSA